MTGSIELDDAGIRFRLTRRNRRTRGRPKGQRWMMWGLRHVDLRVDPGEIVGLIGPNGSGKSTLLRLVAGIYRPDEGSARIRGRVAPLLTPSGGLMPGLSGWDNAELSSVLLGLDRSTARQRTEHVAELAGLGDFMAAPTRVYSAGMRARLGFAVAVSSAPDILVLDEVMAVGDEDFRERSQQTLQAFIARGGTVVFATHEVGTVAETCDRLVRMHEGGIAEQGEPGPIAARYLEAAHHGAPSGPRGRRRALAALMRDAADGGRSAR